MTKPNNMDTDISYIPVEFDPFAGGELLCAVPTTESQKEIFASVKMGDDANCAYNESVSVIIHGSIDVEMLKSSFQDLIKRYEVLRATFTPDGQTLCINASFENDIPFIDLSEMNDKEKDNKLAQILCRVVKEPFDLEQGPLFYVHIVKLHEQMFHVVITIHHIICDGWSIDILVSDVAAIYSAKSKDNTINFDKPDRFSDYALMMAKQANSPNAKETERYWLEQFSGKIPALDFPTDRPRPPVRSFNAAREDRKMSKSLVDGLKGIGAKAGCTFVNVLLAGFNAFLFRLTQQEDMVVGLATSGQSAVGQENLVGHCVNLLPLRSQINGNQAFADYLQSFRSVLLDAYEYQQYTLGRLLTKLKLPRDHSRIPLIPVLFNIDQGINTENIRFDGKGIDFFSNPRAFENFEIFLNIAPLKDSFVFECQYNTNLFDTKTISRRLEEFEILLTGIVDDHNRKISDLPLLSDGERHELLEWNKTGEDYPKDLCLHHLFENQVKKTPDNVAVVFQDRQLTYKELDQRSDRLAEYLRVQGGGPDILVGICVERSLDMVVGLLGILKAGCGYVPLDPEYPRSRLSHMLDDANVPVLLTQSALLDRLPDHRAKVCCLDTDWDKIANEHDVPATGRLGPENPAYVIYTSGSTGVPKGVRVHHGAVVNFLTGMAQVPGFTEKDALLAVTTLSFDIHVLEIFLPLVTGGKTVIAARETTYDGDKIKTALSEWAITVMQATPATWRLLLAAQWEGTKGLKALCGGEAVPKDLVKALLPRTASVWNMYGPTETTVWSTCHRLEDSEGPVLIGSPIANTQIYILDEAMNRVPVGVPGELHIGGMGVTLGYLNRPELTAARFVNDPFGGAQNARLYKTGDLARFRTDGNIEFINRLDNQVKIRGFRIEPGEIESVLSEHPLVREAVVTVCQTAHGDNALVAYVVPEKATSSSSTQLKRTVQQVNSKLRDHLRDKLPGYMIPQHFVCLDTLQLTPAGKIDRNSLPALTNTGVSDPAEYVAPKDQLELQLAAIWEKMLGIDKISIHHNFFDIGGHSLLAVNMFTEIENVFGKKLPLATLFKLPTIARLATVLRKEHHEVNWPSLIPIQPIGEKPPLFLVHGAGGNILLYRDLAGRLGDDQPVYGLQSQGLDGKQALLTRVEDMAAHYLKEIRALQPEGPYYLGGYCLGGQIAYEIAHQFDVQGQKTAFIGLVDTQKKWHELNRLMFLYHEYQRIIFHIKNFSRADGKGKKQFIMEKAAESIRRIKRRIAVRRSVLAYRLRLRKDRPLTVMETVNDRAAMIYDAPSYSGKITVFRPKKPYAGYDDPLLGWGDGLTGGVEVEQLSAFPAGILVEPFVAELAEKFKKSLQKAQN